MFSKSISTRQIYSAFRPVSHQNSSLGRTKLAVLVIQLCQQNHDLQTTQIMPNWEGSKATYLQVQLNLGNRHEKYTDRSHQKWACDRTQNRETILTKRVFKAQETKIQRAWFLDCDCGLMILPPSSGIRIGRRRKTGLRHKNSRLY